nr:tyrosine-type recombinase/integrase [Megasphaera stantonii]
MHVLRHTYATTLLARGVDIKTVAALLGDTVETVIKKYVHYSEEMRRNAAQNIQNIFDLE